MGSGFKTFSAATKLTASDVNNYLQEQVVAYFASTAARDSAITAPERGMTCYIGSNDASEGLYTYNGTTWVRDGALIPHTTVQNWTTVTGSNTASTTYVNMSNSSALSVVKYRANTNLIVTLHVMGNYLTTTDYHVYGVRVNSVDYEIGRNSLAANTRHVITGSREITGLAAATYTVQPRCLVSGGGGGTLTFDNTGGYSMTVIETYA